MIEVEDNTKAGTLATGESAKQATFKIPISTGIFEHYAKLKDAIWLFLWYVDKTTKEVDDGKGNRLGSVLGGSPRRDADVASSFGSNKRTICRWRNRLAEIGFIRQRITPFGAVVQVVKSKKWVSESRDKNVPPPAKGGTQTAQGGTRSARGGTQTALAKKTVQDSTETKQKAESTLRSAASGSDLERRIFSAYEMLGRPKPIWRNTERRKLDDLAEQSDPNEFIAALELYLQEESSYLLTARHPFSVFVKQFVTYRDRVTDERRANLEAEFLEDTIDEMTEMMWREQTVEVEIESKSGLVRREMAIPEIAKLWFASGYARPIPIEDVHEEEFSRSYRCIFSWYPLPD